MAGRTEKDIAEFFKGRDASLKLFNIIRRIIEKDRSPKIEVTKTQISFGEEYKYLWIWLPQTWIKKRQEECIALTIVTGMKIKSERIEESIQPKRGYWTHHIIIESSRDVDAEIEGLIRESIRFYLERLKRKQQSKTDKK